MALIRYDLMSLLEQEMRTERPQGEKQAGGGIPKAREALGETGPAPA